MQMNTPHLIFVIIWVCMTLYLKITAIFTKDPLCVMLYVKRFTYSIVSNTNKNLMKLMQ